MIMVQVQDHAGKFDRAHALASDCVYHDQFSKLQFSIAGMGKTRTKGSLISNGLNLLNSAYILNPN